MVAFHENPEANSFVLAGILECIVQKVDQHGGEGVSIGTQVWQIVVSANCELALRRFQSIFQRLRCIPGDHLG